MLKFTAMMVIAWLPAFAFAAAADATNPSAPFTISPETTSVTGPVRPDGSVDYVAALNERFSRGVTPENNGYVLWLQVMGAKGLPQSIRKQTLALCGAEELKPTDIGWSGYPREPRAEQGAAHLWKAQDDPAYAIYLKSQENILDLATQATAKPQWWSPYVSKSGSMMMVLLPQLNPMRGVALTLCDRALLRAQQGDFDGFLSDVMTAKRLSRRALGPFIVNDLVEIGMDNLADRTIAAAAGAGIFSGDQCAKLAKALDGLEPLHPMWQSVDTGERWSSLDFIESIATGNLQRLSDQPDGGGQLPRMFKDVDRDSVNWNSTLKQVSGDDSQMVEIMKTPSLKDQRAAEWAFDQKFAGIRNSARARVKLAKRPDETNDAYAQRVMDAILSVLLPDLSHAADTYRMGLMEEKMARAVVAAAQYRAGKGKWPDRLDDFIPAYLPEAPREVFWGTGANFVRYRLTPAGVCLTARGPRGNEIELGAVR